MIIFLFRQLVPYKPSYIHKKKKKKRKAFNKSWKNIVEVERIYTHPPKETYTHTHAQMNDSVANQIIIKVEQQAEDQPLAMFGQKLEAHEQTLLKGAGKTFACQLTKIHLGAFRRLLGESPTDRQNSVVNA